MIDTRPGILAYIPIISLMELVCSDYFKRHGLNQARTLSFVASEEFLRNSYQ
jgi:hypothetical protein